MKIGYLVHVVGPEQDYIAWMTVVCLEIHITSKLHRCLFEPLAFESDTSE